MTAKRSIGLAVIGAGKIGRHRARLAARHAGVRFLAISDVVPERAQRLAAEVGADLWTDDNAAAAGHPDVDAVIVSTPEGDHRDPVLTALGVGRPTLVEKPIALTLADADAMIRAAGVAGAELLVGYSMRYAQRYAVAKEQLRNGAIGDLVGGLARTYDTRAVGLAILERSADATPVMDILTYVIDVLLWYHDAEPVEVVARGHGTVLRSHGHDVDDVVWALVTFSDGSVFDLGVSYSLPAGYPIAGLSTRFELVGSAGVLFVTEDHGDQVLHSEKGYQNDYVEQRLELAYLGSRTSGEWALGSMFGRLADETRAWLDHLTVGAPCHITSASEARRALQVTLAIDESARSQKAVAL